MTKAIVLFPGQGSQSVGMGKALAEAVPAAKAVFEAADEAAGAPISALCFEGPEDELTLSHNAQPAVTAVNLAVWAALRERGVEPVAVAGHSLGEYAADAAAGVFDAADAVRLTRRRGELMQICADTHPGGMSAIIGLAMEDVARVCDEAHREAGVVVSVANYNSPTQVVITGEGAALTLAEEKAAAAGASRTVRLNVSGPWHSELMAEAAVEFGQVLDEAPMQNARVPVCTNVDATSRTEAPEIRDALKRQVTNPVRWVQSIETLQGLHPQTPFIECGPGRVLKGILRGIDRKATCVNVEDPKSLDAAMEKISG
jgi:[acyl-carrier-protein] S-malonyltransferase